ncbi:MAG: hypothetical protein JNL60_03595 [Bacteroidia bacterium]|nr:hypothetical protein [Bacteroidia bacterium]
MKLVFPCTAVVVALLMFCTKQQGKNPALAYTDSSLLDSCKAENLYYYKDDSNTLLSGNTGPHGTFKLRFNSLAHKALTENGKLPQNGKFPDGSLIVKDIYQGQNISLYALMYKRGGSWLWAEIEPGGSVHYSVNKNPSACTGCHSQSGNRDLAVTFHFY